MGKNKIMYRCSICRKKMQGHEGVVGGKMDGITVHMHKSCKEKIIDTDAQQP